MHTITFFATKGGTGRTVSTMALASGFLALGKRVVVLDCTDRATTSPSALQHSALQIWRDAMSDCGIHDDRLQKTNCWTGEGVADTIASAKAMGFDIVLIDTCTLPKDAQNAAIRLADLVLSPVIGSLEAKYVANGIHEHLVEPDNLLGMIPGCRSGSADLAATRSAFGDIPVLNTELPWSEAIGDQVVNGDIGQFVASLACHQNEPGYGRFTEAQAAWSAVLTLTIEVQWALDGMRLEHHDPNQQLNFSARQVSA